MLGPRCQWVAREAVALFGRLVDRKIGSGPMSFKSGPLRAVLDRAEADDAVTRLFGATLKMAQAIKDGLPMWEGVRFFYRDGAPDRVKLGTGM